MRFGYSEPETLGEAFRETAKDVVTGAAPTENTPVNLEIGSAADADRWDGQIRLLHSYQYVPTDPEAMRLL